MKKWRQEIQEKKLELEEIESRVRKNHTQDKKVTVIKYSPHTHTKRKKNLEHQHGGEHEEFIYTGHDDARHLLGVG